MAAGATSASPITSPRLHNCRQDLFQIRASTASEQGGKGIYRHGRSKSGQLLQEARAMHEVEIPSWAVERALARRGRLHAFDDLDPARTALVVVDLQNGFMAPGQPAEIVQAREIVPDVNRLARATRAAGGTVVWIQNTITPETEKSWSVWFGHFAREE